MGVLIKKPLDVFSISKVKHCWSFLYEPFNLAMNTDKLKSNRALELDVNRHCKQKTPVTSRYTRVYREVTGATWNGRFR